MKTISCGILVLAMAIGAARGADDPIPSAIQRLGSEEYTTRESAQRELIQLADAGYEPVLKACASAYRESKDPEVRHRLLMVMKKVVDQYPFRAPRGFLGVTIGGVNAMIFNRPGLNNLFIQGGKVIVNGVEWSQRGLPVSSVVPNSSAAKAGMQANDVIIAINGKPWEGGDSVTFTRMIQTMKPGTKVKFSVQRAAQTNEVTTTLGELPAAERERALSAQESRAFFAKWWEENIGEPMPEEE